MKWLRLKIPLILLAAIIVFSFFLTLKNSKDNSATDDETAHIAAGYLKLKEGYFNFFIEQPPLVNSISALPLIVRGIRFDTGLLSKQNDHWAVGNKYIYHSDYSPEEVLFWARLPIIILFMFLIMYVYWFLFKITNSQYCSLLGATLTAFCPNLTAHAGLATVDLGATLFIFLAATYYILFLVNPTKKSLVFVGILTGLAFIAKISALILIPYFILVFLVYRLIFPKKEVLNNSLPKIFIVAFVSLFAVYFLELRSNYLITEYGNNAIYTRIYAAIAEYAKQIKVIIDWSINPFVHPQFLLGQYSFSGWWYYYPVALALKTPISALLLFIFSLIAFVTMLLQKKIVEKNILFTTTSCLIFICLFLAAAAVSHLNIGLRYVLPIYPFTYVFIAVVCYQIFKQIKHFQKSFIVLILIVVFFSGYEFVKTYPSYISYFNEFVKPENYDKYLIDSNLDWGQDLKRLGKWMENNNINKIRLDYFGGGDPDFYLKDKYTPWGSTKEKESGYYAVSRHKFRISALLKGKIITWPEYVKNMKLVTIIGDSIYVFKH